MGESRHHLLSCANNVAIVTRSKSRGILQTCRPEEGGVARRKGCSRSFLTRTHDVCDRTADGGGYFAAFCPRLPDLYPPPPLRASLSPLPSPAVSFTRSPCTGSPPRHDVLSGAANHCRLPAQWCFTPCPARATRCPPLYLTAEFHTLHPKLHL